MYSILLIFYRKSINDRYPLSLINVNIFMNWSFYGGNEAKFRIIYSKSNFKELIIHYISRDNSIAYLY